MEVMKVVEVFVKEKHVEEFSRWAFGEGSNELTESLEFMDAWNLLHSDKLTLEADGCMREDIHEMVKIWIRENGKGEDMVLGNW